MTADLRETVMQARMQPVGHLFSKFPRMVRDLATDVRARGADRVRGAGDGVGQEPAGGDRDPLTHAVRNAVDHGIEAPEERVRAGKPAEGVVRLRAFHQSGSVVIEVSDDGAGISMERVLAKAMERGLVTAEQAASMTERETMQLIFLAGFSTAEEVTQCVGARGGDGCGARECGAGGRQRGDGVAAGAGDDGAAARAVDAGDRSGAGGAERRAELRAAAERIGGAGVCAGREAGRRWSGLARRSFIGCGRDCCRWCGWTGCWGWLRANRVRRAGFISRCCEAEGRRFGLVVDELMAPEEIVVKPLSAVLREIGVFSGATVLGNGTLALILDVAATAERAGVRAVEETAKRMDAAAIETGRGAEFTLLVFEDRRGERRRCRWTRWSASRACRWSGLSMPEDGRCCSIAASCCRWRDDADGVLDARRFLLVEWLRF